YDDSANLQITQLPAGIAVNSHLLHFNTAGMSLVTLEGTVTFDTVIIGVILSSELLNASDSTLGRDDLVYPSTTEGRGLELDDPTSQADLFEISADRRSIRYAGTVESHLDQIRVITLAGADC